MAFLPLFPILHGVTGSVFREHLLSPTSFSQSLNFASRISFLPFCTSFVPIWTRLFCSSSWKPVQTPMRSAALALAAKSPCHPPWSHSPAASLMMVGLSCRPGVWFYRGAFRLTLGEAGFQVFALAWHSLLSWLSCLPDLGPAQCCALQSQA